DIEGDLVFCEDKNTELTINEGFKTYLWSTSSTSANITVSDAGVYSVTVTDFNDCTAVDEVTVEAIPLPVPIIEGDLAFCEDGSTNLSLADTYTDITWSNGMDSAMITVESGGIYSVTVTNTEGCTGTDEVTVVENTNPEPIISGDLEICEGENTKLSVPAIYTSYAWETGEDTPSIEVSATGTYSIEVTDDNGCTGVEEVTVIVFDNPEPNISGSSTFCTGGNTTLDAGEGFSEYLWNTGATSRMITVNTADTYSVEVKSDNGCVGSTSIDVSESGELSLQIGGDSEICDGESTTLDAGEGFAEYLWNTGATTQMIVVNSSGTYSVEVEDANGCIGSGSIEVTLLALPQVDIEGEGNVCEGESTILNAEGGFETYLWSTGENTQTIEISGGSYFVTVTNTNNCSNSVGFEVGTFFSPLPNITGNTSFCEGEDTSLDAGDFDTYIWSTGEMERLITVSESGTYSVTVSYVNGCTGATSIEVNVFSLPTVEIGGSSTFCEGSSTTLSVTGDFENYLWNTGETSQSIVVDEAGNYSVEVTDANGCKNTESMDVEETSALMPTIVGDLDFCEGGNSSLDAGASFESYLWNTGATTRTIEVTEGGTYSVTVTDASGCSGSDEVTITVHIPVQPSIEGEADFCLGESTILDAGAGFQSYLWNTGEGSQTITISTGGTYTVNTIDVNGCSSSDEITVQENIAETPIIEGELQFCLGTSTILTAQEGYASYLWNTGETTQTIEVSEEQTYNVEVTDDKGCTATNEVNTIILEAEEPEITGALQFCAESSTTLEASIGYVSYLWNTGETTRTITVSESDNYAVGVTDENGCTSGAFVVVEEREELEVALSGSSTICNGSSASIEVASDYESYLWSTGETTKDIIVDGAGTYMVTVTNENQCTGMASQTVIESDSLEPSVVGDLIICNEGSTELDAGGGFDEYLWSTGATTRTIEVTEGGDYSVEVTNSDGCSGSAMESVTLIAFFTPNILGNLSFCLGESTQLIAEPGYSNYVWSNGDMTPIISATEPGVYTLLVTDDNGCTGINQVEVEELPKWEVEITGDLQIASNESTTLDAGTYSTSDEYLWSTGNTEQTIVVEESGVYGVTVTN
ncbi:MAG: hypothetical protein ACPGVB_07610, partial [Chitinophagales bacterium]